ncbi:MAG: toll/interleukin-1 receptor domain-containing protein [Ignavibacteriae bacterium]|nr:toll/interleukin-1 receptor domain-containing protein [Ignavibacteriota bacterium]
MKPTAKIRDTIFIGHANPEDNEFTLWLYGKLKNEGYSVECDLTWLKGGEADYWQVLQDVLENKTCKYLLVLSKDTFTKQGVIDEWEQTKVIGRRLKLSDFVMVLKIDDVNFDVRIGVNVKNHFRFDESWAKALKKLLFKLHNDNVPRNEKRPLSVDDWIKNRYSTDSYIYKRYEVLYSNWLAIINTPKRYYVYEYSNANQVEAVLDEIHEYPAVKHDKYLITFLSDVPSFSREHGFDIPYSKRTIVDSVSIFNNIDYTDFPVLADRKRFFVRLLNVAFEMFVESLGLASVIMSGNKKCYLYLDNQLVGNKVHFEYEGKQTWKQLVGTFYKAKWHYGMSCKAMLYPQLCYVMNAHLLFSDEGKKIWNDSKKLHRARRSKGKAFFNADWRMLMLAFLNSLADEGNEIHIPLTPKYTLKLSSCTMMFESTWGFDDPKQYARLVPLDYYDNSADEAGKEENDECEDE